MTDEKSKFEKHHSVTREGVLLLDCLHQMCPHLSRQALKNVMQAGAVWLTHGKNTARVRRAKRPLKIGDAVHIYYDEKVLTARIKPPTLIADEVSYSVWDKPGGMFSQGTKWGDANSICRWVEVHGFPDRPAFQVHRLDRATSGLMIVAHAKKSAAKFSLLFESRRLEKIYQAWVHGEFPAIEIIDAKIEGKVAVTRILEKQYDGVKGQTRLVLKIDTGRKHQIRKHLAELGYPIIGDRLYGDKTAADKSAETKHLPDLQLRACSLSFVCPVENREKKFRLA